MSNLTSIIIPAFNEAKTITKILIKIEKLKIKKEIIVVDDGSTDKTNKLVKKFIKNKTKFKLIKQKNKGKGAAIKLGIKRSKGGIIAIQDADLEYNPEDLEKLVKTLIKEKINVIYGSRFINKGKKGKLTFYLGNKTLSLITSILFINKITDMETCYKVFRKKILKNIKLKSNKFDFEPEITAKILKKGYKIKETPINYNPRTDVQGKKIKFRDGFFALKCLIKYRFFN